MDPVKRDRMIERLDSIKNLKQWKAYIQGLLKENDEAVKQALVRLYNCQEQDEMRDKKSVHENGVGFNKIDAYYLSKSAEKVLQGKQLSESELNACRWSIMKYWRQLAEMSKKKLAKMKFEKQIENETEEQKQIRENGFYQPMLPGTETY
jgi:hypothetical protein